MMTNYYLKNSKQEFVIRLGRIVALYGFFYACLFTYLKAYFTAEVFLATSALFYPAMLYCYRKKRETAASFTLISAGLIFIYTAIVTIKPDFKCEMYYLPAMLLSLLVFDGKQKTEVFVGVTLPFVAWILGLHNIAPNFPVFTYTHKLSTVVLSNINFTGVFIITAVFLNYYRQHLVELNRAVNDEMEKFKNLSQHLNNSQRLAKIGNWQLNFKGSTLIWSDEVFRIFDVSRENFVPTSQSFNTLIHPEDREMLWDAFNKAIKNKHPFEVTHRLLMDDGKIKFVREQCEIFYDEKDEPECAMGTIQDITESKLQDEVINHSAKMAALGEMAGGIAHEINNPLTIISGRAHSMIRRLQLTKLSQEQVIDELSRIITSVDRISRIVRSLRTISRNGESDPLQISSIHKIVDDVCDLSLERFRTNEVELKLEIPENAEVMCRPSEIGQVVLNLINNAFDAVVHLDEKWVELKAEPSGQFMKITVTDSGKGIPKFIVDKLMFSFFTTKDAGKGTGLGLSICKRIVEKHQGHFYYDEKAANTSFVIELPLAEVSSQKMKNAS